MTMHRMLAATALVLALAAALAGSARRGSASRVDVNALAREIETEADHVTAMELAGWIRERKQGLRVIDVRADTEFASFHIPSAKRVPLTELARLTPRDGEILVLYSEGGAHAAQGWVLLRALGHKQVYFLRGGLLDWMENVLSPALPMSAAHDSLAALSRYFGGVPRASSAVPLPAAPTATSAVERIRRRGC